MRSAREIAEEISCGEWDEKAIAEVAGIIAAAQQEAWYELRDAAVECVMRTRGEAYTVADAITALPFPIPEVTP